MGASSDSRRSLEDVRQSCSLCVYPCTHRALSIGRGDDVLILASGENVVPAPMEDIIMSSPLVGGTLIFGRGRNQVGVLLESRPDVKVDDLVEFRNKIWCVPFTTYIQY
jgi:acyl-CoA synthetase (AMP-forming)/AMP-acid ligase II